MATLSRPTSWQDWAVPAALLVGALGEVWIPGLAKVDGPRIVFCLLAVGCSWVLLFRRTRPLTTALALGVVLLVPVPLGWFIQSAALVLMLAVAVFACGRYGLRPSAYLAIPLASVIVLIESGPDPDQDLSGSLGWSLNTIWVFALGTAFRRERLLRQQVAQASAAHAQAAAAEERLRVARELHDVLSHSLSVVVVQAEVADAFLDSDPQRSRQAIHRVAATGRAALADTRRIVGLMRDPDRPSPSPPRPGVGDVPALVERVRESGLPVALDMGPQLPSLTADATATAYRVVQESLTNVLKHAGKVPTTVNLACGMGALVIDIRDRGGNHESATAPWGHGLLGMRERVLSAGGELTSGPCPGGGFQVRAVLPCQDEL